MISYGDIKSGEATMPAAVAPIAKEVFRRLPDLVESAARQLAKAKDAAEVLDAKDKASLIYDAAKRAARLAAAKGAHDALIAAAHRAQANALKIEAQAKERLADEYDAAQPKDAAVAGRPKKSVPEQDAFTAEGAGLSRKIVHDARRVRNAEQAKPGVVAETVEKALADGKEPTRAMVNAAVADALGETAPVDTRTEVEREADAIQSPFDRASDEGRALFLARNHLTESNPATSMGGDDVDRSAERASSAVKVGATNSPDGAAVSASSGRPEGGKRLQVLRGPNHAAEPDVGQPIREEVGIERAIAPSVTAGETATVPVAEQSAGNGQRDRQHVHSRQTDDAKHGGQDQSAAALDHATNSEMPANPAASPARQATAAPEVTPPPASGATHFKALSKADQIRLLRPNCQHPGSDLCGGSGRRHCRKCAKPAEEGEAA